jgi:hypothetical protein
LLDSFSARFFIGASIECQHEFFWVLSPFSYAGSPPVAIVYIGLSVEFCGQRDRSALRAGCFPCLGIRPIESWSAGRGTRFGASFFGRARCRGH